MKTETAEYLAKARDFLRKARHMLDSWPDEAGRAAYFAGFHAAQAAIFEFTGTSSKTHSGVQTQFARIVKDDSRFDAEARGFLGRAFGMKTVADYGTGPGGVITKTQASATIESATRFVECVWGVIEARDRGPKPGGD